MKRLFLIYGNPGSGKTTLTDNLRDEHFFEKLSLDELYVKFVKEKCPDFYFNNLKNYILQHYHDILDNNGYTKQKFKRDLVGEWHEYIFIEICKLLAVHNTLAVEGYLLINCLNDLEARISPDAQVFPVRVHNYTYLYKNIEMNINDIVVLGQTDEHTE